MQVYDLKSSRTLIVFYNYIFIYDIEFIKWTDDDFFRSYFKMDNFKKFKMLHLDHMLLELI